MNGKSYQQGFTLVEIMVALVVMSVIMVLAYQAFDGILAMENRSKEDFLQENRQSVAFSILLNDFVHMRARPARDQLGGERPAYLAPSGDYAVEFTRGGLPDVSAMAGGIQRVAYQVEDNKLVRVTWERVDITATTETRAQVLATGIREIRVEQLDQGGRFIPNWPPLDVELSTDSLPPMVKVVLVTTDGESDEMLVPGAGVLTLAGERDP